MSSRRRLLVSSAALVLSSVLAGAAVAQTQTQTQPEATDVDTVVVVAGSQVELPNAYAGGQVARGGRVGLFGAMDMMSTPYATTAYTEELARDQQAHGVGDVLQNDPAVRVSKGYGNFQELYVIRGFPVYSDDMTYNGVYGVLPRQFVAAEFLERVEVFHGANAFLNGAAPGGSGVGGAFNLVPKRAGDEPLTRATVGVESGGQLYGALDAASRFGADEAWGARVNVARRDGETSVDRQERELSVLGLSVDRQGEQFRFSADLGFQDHRIDAPRPSATPWGAVPAAPDASANFGQDWTFTDERQLFGVVRGEFDVSKNVSVWAAVGGRDGEEHNVLANPSVGPDGATTSYRFDNKREDSIVSADAGVRAKLITGPVRHTLVASASKVELESRNAWAASDWFAPFAGSLYASTQVPAPATIFGAGDMDAPLVTERTENASVAVADLLSFMDGKLLATVGARWQQIDTRTFNYTTGAPDSAYKDDAVTPALALVFRPTDTVSIYANYSEALTPGKVVPATTGGGAPLSNAGEVLAPFRAEQYELGVKYDNGRIGGSASVFDTTLPSIAVVGDVMGAFGEQRNRGLELALFGEPVEGLRLLGGATFVDTETPDGVKAIGVPDMTFNANLEWDVPAVSGLTLEGRVIYTGEQQANAANTTQLDAFTRLDLGARYDVTVAEKPITLRARVENITDEAYWASTGGYPGANYLVLGAPRTFVLSASVDF
ncbi:TonB-dependent receptor [Caulobacter sp. 17J65-9]|uniref:TonB-dependent receptor n=1 Tax=Caulobacter sp. 17J65-9 TaxID=2709382 RepID=UPI0013CDA0B1|nr:TonB-dependent receptor [Caulobacter sp. 17J65-9]NEX93333.1 TonB-dependent receptor [Caulobacter sp. 17J65-9]